MVTLPSTANMEADERPNKKRKLSNDDQAGIQGEAKTSAAISTNGLDQTKHNEDQRKDEASKNEDSLENAMHSTLIPGNTTPLDETTEDLAVGPTLSKNQQKKLRKQQEWEAKRDERRVMRKQKTAAKKERKREKMRQLASNGDPSASPSTKPDCPKAVQLPITFLIDCDFDDLMQDKERVSLAAQITRAYSDNRKSAFRAHLAVCSFTGLLRKRFDHVLTHYKGWKGVKFLDCDFVEAAKMASGWMSSKKGGELAGAFSKLATDDGESIARPKDEGEVVYLTSDSNDTLTELRPYSTYIIGGLVDKNREKGICYKRALKRGIKTARLPIGEFMDMRTRKILATNHVNELMLKWLECGDWGEAFLTAIPKRKGGKLKDAEDSNAVGEQADGGDRSNGSFDHGSQSGSADELDDDAEHGGVEIVSDDDIS